MRRLITTIQIAGALITRCVVALRYMRQLNYSRKLAWAMAAR